MHFRGFSEVQGTKWGIFYGGGVLKFHIFFGGGGVKFLIIFGVRLDAGSEPTY